MIEVTGISKYFGTKQALSDINFVLNDGEVTALIGENGAGKSTLMRIMCGFLAPSTGKVNIYGYNIESERMKALQHIGYVPEIACLYSDMLVYDFLSWMANLWHIKNPSEAIIQTAKQMKIIDVLSQKIDSLSKGYKKRVQIASAILHTPKFLILDEPTDGLDPNQKYDIRVFIQNYAKEHIVLVSTHVLEDVDGVDKVLMLSDGKIIQNTPLADFKKISKHKNLGEAFRILSQQKRGKK